MNQGGYFNVPRAIFNDAAFLEDPMSHREAFLWLVANAAREPITVPVQNGRSKAFIDLHWGQLSYSRSFLREKWKWTSEKKVRTFLELMQRRGLLSIHRGQQTAGQGRELPPVITICNYERFQPARPVLAASNEPQGASKGPARGQQTGQRSSIPAALQVIENKGVLELPAPKRASKGPAKGPEEEEKKDIYPAGFEDWWKVYPRKEAKPKAVIAFRKAVPSLIALPSLMEKTKTFATDWKAKPEDQHKFIPHPASWLNGGRYSEVRDKPEHIGPRAYSDADWQLRLKYFREADIWHQSWGAMPGDPGCLVPRHLMIAEASKKGVA